MNQIVDIATLIIVLAGITVLVRPSSKGPQFVTSLSSGFANVIGSATKF